MTKSDSNFLERLLQKRKSEILTSKAFKFYIYFRDRYIAKKVTRQNNLSSLKNAYYRKYGQTWMILKYSRICDPNLLPFEVSKQSYIKKENFKLHLQTLRRTANIISLQTLTNYLDNNEQPPLGSIVITMDDGYNSAYFDGLPSLLDYEVPATFAIPTAYIGTNLLMWDIFIESFTRILAENKIPFVPIPSLSELHSDLISQTLEKSKLPGPTTAQSLLYLFLSLPPEDKAKFFQDLGAILADKELSLPNWVDFMDWEQILDLQKGNYQIISKLHSALPPNILKIADLKNELENSFAMFDTYEIPLPNVVSLPYDAYNKNTMNTLAEYNIQYALGGKDAPNYYEQNTPCKILKRKTLLDGNTTHEELLLLNLYAN